MGLDDCPSADRFAIPPDGFLRPDGVALRRWRRARTHYHAVLVEHLRRNGASTTEEMIGRLGWFRLTFSAKEVVWLVDSARRRGVVAPLEIERDASGAGVVDEWTPTEKGAKLNAPRGAGFSDLQGNLVDGVTWLGKAMAILRGAVPVLVAFASLIGLAALKDRLQGNDDTEHLLALSIGAGAVLAILAAVLVVGMRGERSLRDAAVCWPRLAGYRPARYAWETCGWRHWVFPLGIWLAVALFGAAGVSLHHAGHWVTVVLFALAVYVTAIVAGLYVRWLPDLKRPYREELHSMAARRSGGRR